MPRTDPDRSAALRALPPVDQILRLPALASLSRAVLLREARAWLERQRGEVLAGRLDAAGVAAACDDAALVATLTACCRTAARG
ncbi:MAG: hypothetical protein K8J09_07525, partial [Planctomycetes bacterium]|nr:hypothetical protein [Planctomycetota bacterium]